MAEDQKLHRPWMVGVWPGMGNVALNAGIYLLSKLKMTLFAELAANDLVDVEYVEVTDGIIQLGRRPRNRFFLWSDPQQQHDLIVFLGEAQLPIGKYSFCRQLVEFSRQLGVERVYTFAAMATQMHPAAQSRVFAAATDPASLEELKGHELEVLENGHVGGLNGILLGVAKESQLHGGCLLGEMPHIFSQLPFPKASLAILKVFAGLRGIEIDFTELEEQAKATEQQLEELLSQVEKAYGQEYPQETEPPIAEPAPEDRLSASDRRRIDEMFEQAAQDRSKAFELKRELDRLEVFREYEDRFLDLFKHSE